MNAKTDKWESYTDKTGRRHWRWPATSEPIVAARLVDSDEHHEVGLPRWQQADGLPEPNRGD